MNEYFKKLKDDDFFSDKLTHIYFNGIVEKITIDKLFEDVREANKRTEIHGKIINLFISRLSSKF
jgi:N-acetylneuraminic acid mutarotase